MLRHEAGTVGFVGVLEKAKEQLRTRRDRFDLLAARHVVEKNLFPNRNKCVRRFPAWPGNSSTPRMVRLIFTGRGKRRLGLVVAQQAQRGGAAGVFVSLIQTGVRLLVREMHRQVEYFFRERADALEQTRAAGEEEAGAE